MIMSMTKQELQSYIDRYKNELVNDVIPFWQKNSPDRVHGGFYNYLGRDGKVLHTDKNVRQLGRQTLLYARAYCEIEPRKEWLDLALNGIEFIEKYDDLPRIGTANKLYAVAEDKLIYLWNTISLKYESFGSSGSFDPSIISNINGGTANG